VSNFRVNLPACAVVAQPTPMREFGARRGCRRAFARYLEGVMQPNFLGQAMPIVFIFLINSCATVGSESDASLGGTTERGCYVRIESGK
jgi:hypothetical protein